MEARIKETETLLNTLGTVEDISKYTLEEYRDKVPKSYTLYEDKYNDSTDDSLTIEIYADGTYSITNDDLPYSCNSITDLKLLEESFLETPFKLETIERKENGYYASVAVTAKVKNIYDVKRLILQFRTCNDKYLSDKIKEIVGDDGRIYLDRLNE